LGYVIAVSRDYASGSVCANEDRRGSYRICSGCCVFRVLRASTYGQCRAINVYEEDMLRSFRRHSERAAIIIVYSVKSGLICATDRGV
jgi:hypothetical protein